MDQLKMDLKRLIEKRVKQKNKLETSGLAGAPCCLLAQKARDFVGKMRNKSVPDKSLSPEPHQCNHTTSEQEIKEECIQLYEKFLKFKRKL